MKIRALLLCLSASILLPACGTGSPDAYIEESSKISCQYLKKCEEAMFEMAGFDSVKDCRDQFLDMDLGGEGSLREQFVAGCTNFDGGAARKCLAAGRKAKRGCDDLTTVEEPACEEVCGPVQEGDGLALAEPLSGELVARALEELDANGELEPASELTVEQ